MGIPLPAPQVKNSSREALGKLGKGTIARPFPNYLDQLVPLPLLVSR
jgi:hypothetical protein